MCEVKSIISYSIDELKKMVLSPEYGPVVFSNGWPIHLVLDPKELNGEVFRKDPENEMIECSNLGRVRYNNEILEQSIKGKDYLEVQIPGDKYPTLVYHIVYRTWCNNIDRDENVSYEIHHISNNGFDNRPSNLVLLSRDEHKKIPTPKSIVNDK